MEEQDTKAPARVRTSITIKPGVLEKVKAAITADKANKSVSHVVEAALEAYLK